MNIESVANRLVELGQHRDSGTYRRAFGPAAGGLVVA